MPNAVRETTTTTPSGSIRKGSVSIGLNGNLGPTNTTLFVNGITPTTGKYVIYKMVGQAGVLPLIFAPQSDAELIRFANSEFSGITSVSGALEEFASKVQYLAVNKAYPSIITDNLVYLIDSTFTPSYPTSGTTTYPIRDVATVGTGALQNGVGFNSNTGAFIFDGSDDQIPLATSDNFQNIDFSTGFTLMVLYKIDAVTDFNGQFRCMIGVTGGGRTWNYYLYGPSNPATTLLYHFSGQMSNGLSSAVTVTSDTYHLGAFTIVPGTTVGTYYHDGVVVSTQTAASSPSYTTAGGTQYIGRGDNMWKGNIAKVMIYNKALTQSEILQNYYQGNIVTDGLILSYDSSNLVSYPGSGNTWFDMSGNGNHGTISNGDFIPDNYSGYLRNTNNISDFFVINIPNSISLSNTLSVTTGGWTIEEIIWTNSTNYPEADAGSVFSNPAYGPGATGFDWNHGYGISSFQFGQSSNSATGYEDTVVVSSIPSQYAQFNTWRIRTMVWDRSNNTVSLYINGVYIGGGSTPNTAGQSIYDGDGGSVGTLYGWKFYGRRGAFKIWNRVLSPQEIQQNFSAQSSRFGLI